MDLETLFRSSEADLQEALADRAEVRVNVTADARLHVRRGEERGYEADLRVEDREVGRVTADDLTRFRQQLKEQIATHVSRDQQPDLTRL